MSCIFDTQCIVVVGTDVDLLILLIQLPKRDNPIIYLYKPGTGKSPDKIYAIKCLRDHLSYASNFLLFTHAMSLCTGCDTTSALYRQGKKKAFNILLKNQELQEQVTKVGYSLT